MSTGQTKSLKDLEIFGKCCQGSSPKISRPTSSLLKELGKELEKIAEIKSCKPALLALAWLRSLSNKNEMPTVVQVLGVTTAEKVKENAVDIELIKGEMNNMGTILASCEIVGDRHHP